MCAKLLYLRALGKYLDTLKRSSRLEVFCRKDVLRNFAKFTGKHLCQSLFLNKVAGLTVLKKRFRHRCFPVNFAKFLRIPLFTEHLWLKVFRHPGLLRLVYMIFTKWH